MKRHCHKQEKNKEKEEIQRLQLNNQKDEQLGSKDSGTEEPGLGNLGDLGDSPNRLLSTSAS